MAQEKSLYANRSGSLFEMYFTYKLPFTAGVNFNSGPSAFTGCGNSWEWAADSYREWARRQWWAAPKTGLAAPPSWLMDGLMMMHSETRPWIEGYDLVPRDQWGEMLSAWKSHTSAGSAAVMFINFENYGSYTTPYITPFYPSDAEHTALLDDIHAEGNYNFAMVSTLNYQIERNALATCPYFNNWTLYNAEKWDRCVVDRNGNVQTYGAPGESWWGLRAYLCPGVGGNRDLWNSNAAAMANVGIDIVEHDQMNGGYTPPCYATWHGHPPGWGIWMRESVSSIMEGMRTTGQAINPNTGSCLEDPSEIHLPYLDSSMSRVSFFGFWPGQGSGSYIVGAFQFVYNPLLRSTAPFQNWGNYHSDIVQLYLARVFIAGASPWSAEGMYAFSGENYANQPWPDNIEPYSMELFTNVVKTQAGIAKPFMMHGERLVCEPINITDPSWLLTQDGLDHPRVLSSAWQAPDGRVAFMFVNSMLSPAAFDFDFVVEGKQIPSTSKVKVYENGVLDTTTTVSGLGDVQVPANGTIVAEFEPVHVCITQTGADPGSNTVSFKVTFSEPVTNVTDDDFELSAEPVLGSNLMTNGDFESGDLTNWNYTNDVSVVSTDAHGGNYSALGTDFGKGINYKHGWGSTAQAVSVEPGKNYRVRMWAKTTSTGRVNFYHYYDDNGYCFYSREPASGMILNKRYGDIKQWTLFENDFTAGGTHFSMCFESESDIYVDDVEVLGHLSVPTGSSISNITTSDNKVYLVTVDSGTGAGSIGLSLKRHNDIITTSVNGGVVFGSGLTKRSDLNCDWQVNIADYAKFAAQWLMTGCSEPDWCSHADLNRQGVVDITDLAVFSQSWLNCTRLPAGQCP